MEEKKNAANEKNEVKEAENARKQEDTAAAEKQEQNNGVNTQGISGENKESVEELLKQILKAEKKEGRYAKASAFFTFGLFVILLAAVVILVPKVVETLTNINNTAISVEATITEAAKAIENAEQTIENIDAMSGSLTTTSDTMNSMLVDNSQNLMEAVNKMNNIDFEGLNEAIKDLQDAVGPFAKFMNRLK